MNVVDEQVVVVVEDDPAIGDLVGLYLRRAGFRPLLAATGPRGLELIEQHHPALAVLDVGLPDVDGFEVGRRLRVGTPDLPVLFLTARGAEADRLAGFELGADDYVVKLVVVIVLTVVGTLLVAALTTVLIAHWQAREATESVLRDRPSRSPSP